MHIHDSPGPGPGPGPGPDFIGGQLSNGSKSQFETSALYTIYIGTLEYIYTTQTKKSRFPPKPESKQVELYIYIYIYIYGEMERLH